MRAVAPAVSGIDEDRYVARFDPFHKVGETPRGDFSVDFLSEKDNL